MIKSLSLSIENFVGASERKVFGLKETMNVERDQVTYWSEPLNDQLRGRYSSVQSPWSFCREQCRT